MDEPLLLVYVVHRLVMVNSFLREDILALTDVGVWELLHGRRDRDTTGAFSSSQYFSRVEDYRLQSLSQERVGIKQSCIIQHISSMH